MTTVALNNLWTYLQGLSLARNDRDWLAGKLLEATEEEPEALRQQGLVKESLYRALDEVEAAKRGEHKMMSEEEFLEELKAEGIL